MTFSGVFLLLIVRLLESGYRKSDTQVRKVDDGSAFEGNGERCDGVGSGRGRGAVEEFRAA